MGLRATTSNGWLARLLLILALLAPIFAATPAQAAITFPIKINFQSQNAPVPTGYFRDFGEAYGLRTGTSQGGSQYTYGWVTPGTTTPLALVGNGRDRNSSNPDQRFDTLMHMQADDVTNFSGVPAEGAWEIELPNGIYNVTVAVGDPTINTPVERHYVRVEGQAVISNFQATGGAGDPARHRVAAAQVTVNDGRLTVDAQIANSYNTKINFIEIAQSDGSLPRPSVFAVNPANGATGVRRDANVSATLTLPNGGLNGATVTSSSVYLVRTSDNQVVSANVNTSGGGDVLVLTPLTFLEPNTQYTFVATDAVRDAANQPLVPFSSSFTTGTAGGPGSNTAGIVFQQVPNVASGVLFSSVEMGPDNKLYVATLTGFILRYAINPDGTLALERTISTVRDQEGGDRAIIGLAFDPASTPTAPILWVSHNGPYVAENAADWTGKIARLSGPDLTVFQNYVVNLPHSYKDHMANSLEFGPDGALYISVGSNSGTGAADAAWGNRPERLLSAAILRINLAAITAPPLNVKTEEGGTYNPWPANAPVRIFASGVRNAYDLVWHTNGELYTATNGSARGGNVPGTPATLPAICQNRIDDAANGDYTGPVVGARNSLADQRDYLFRVQAGKYYGHPNPTRCEWVLSGGNPTAGVDPFEVPEYAVGTLPDRNFGGVAYDFNVHKSPNGMIEYKSEVFNGALKGSLLVVRYSENDDIIVLKPGASKDIGEELVGLPGLTGLTNPLDLTEDTRNGNVYVIEHGPASRIALLRPLVGNVAAISLDREELIFTDTVGGAASASQTITIRNQGTAQMTISGATIVGANANQFAISAAPPNTIAAQSAGTIQINFNPTTVGPKLAVLRITSDAVNAPTIEVTLRGLGVAGQGGTNEPSLQWILDTYEIRVNVGDPNPADNALPATALLGEEVALQRFERADNANPVIVQPLAVFGPTGTNPVVRFGWYPSGNPGVKSQLFQVSNTPALNGQRLNPPVESGATLSFDPGLASFGFYSSWPFFADREVFSEDALNTWEPTAANQHKVRVYPLKDSTGAAVENAYIVATEENTSGYDYQDVVVIVRNVRPFGTGPEPVPAPPTNLAASAGDRQISLTWTPGSGAAAASYAIYRSATPTVSTAGTPLATSASAAFTDTGLTNGTTYYYAVVALNGAGQASGPSNVASATPFAPSGTIEIFNPDRVPYNDRLVFYEIVESERKNHNRIDLQVRNLSATETLRVSTPTISGPNPTAFVISSPAPLSIPPLSTRTIRINLVDDRTPEEKLPPPGQDEVFAVSRFAFLNINSSDASQPNIRVELAGIIQDEVGGDREPTPQQIFDVFGYGSVSRYPFEGRPQYETTALNPSGTSGAFAAFGDEVLSTNGLWTRANASEPVYVRQLVATHGDTNGSAWDTVFRLSMRSGGTCQAIPDPDNIPNNTQTCAFWNNGPDWHEFLPPIYNATTSPSSDQPAEMYAYPVGNFEVFVGGYGSARHTASPARAHAVRFFALRDRQGNLVPNTYLVGQDIGDFLSTAANWDYQDNVYLVTNIRPAVIANDTTVAGLTPGAEGLVLEFNRDYPGSLLDKDGQATGFTETQRNEEVAVPADPPGQLSDTYRPDLPPSTSYDPTKLDVNTAGAGTLAITSSLGSNANTVDNLVNGLCLPFNAKTAPFVMQTRLLGPLGPVANVQQAGVMFGPNTFEYIKLVVQSSGTGRLSLQFGYEQHFNNVQNAMFVDAPGSPVTLPASNTISSLDLRLTGDPVAGTVEAAYSINGAAYQTLPNKITLNGTPRGRFFDRNGNGCILAFHRGSTTPAFTATFDRFAITPAPELLAARTLLARINTGGPTVVVDGQTWQGDRDPVIYTTSGTGAPDEFPQPPAAIANTTLDRVYQDYRGRVQGVTAPSPRTMTYSIPVAGNNKVALRLHFAELFWGLSGRQGPGQRIFDVYAEGKLVLDDFDIFRAAGGANTAIVVPIENVEVADGTLTLMFQSIVDNTAIAGIEVFKQPDNAPVADAGLDQKVALGATVTLIGNAFDNFPPQTYRWTQVGGTPVTLSAGGIGKSVTFQAPASNSRLEFELTVTNNLGLTGTDRVVVQVGDTPVAGLSASNDSPKVINEAVTLSATVTAGDNVTYTWDFGDGNTGTGASVAHVYTTPGSFIATVTATNDAGSTTATTTVTVLAEQPFELRINSGGPQYVDAQGRTWIADLQNSNPRYSVQNGNNTTNVFTNANVVITNGDPNPTIYQTERYGRDFNYNIPNLPADDYIVTLHFAEIFIGAPGSGQNSTATRRFDVNIVDPVVPAGTEPEINDLNLRAQYGTGVAAKLTYTVRVTDGTLNIRLNSLAANNGSDNAKISGIEIVRVINAPPSVNAGPDQNVQPGATVTLAGSVSDPEGGATTFTWAQTAGAPVTLTGADTLTPSFVASAKGSYSFRLTGLDDAGQQSSDTVTIVVANRAPTVTASATPPSVAVGEASQLNATASDPDGDTLTYSWAQTGGPATASTIANPNAATASFTPSAKGVYTFTVTVSDGDTGGTATANATLTVVNGAPTVTASAAPATVNVGEASQLSATADDPDGDTLTYSWAQTGGPAGGTLTGASSASASFTPAAKGVYTFTVTVNDGDTGGTASAEVTLTARNRAPVADAGDDQTVDASSAVSLDGSGSSDPDGDAVTYLWTQTGGAAVTLTGATTATPSFTAPGAPGALSFELVVTDAEGEASIADSVTVTVQEAAIAGLSASSDAPTVLGQPTSFSAAITAGSSVSYSWDFGNGATATGASPQYTYPAAGSYTATVTASNSLGSTSSSVLVTVTNAEPAANAGLNQTVLVGAAVTLNGAGSSDPDGHTPLSYRWEQSGGPAVTLAGATTATPSFTAPATPTVLSFELTVTDSRGLAGAPATVLVTVTDTDPQDVTASSNGPTVLGQATSFTATARGTNLTYSWSFGDGNTGSGATVSHTYAAEGSYIATVTVRNGSSTVGTASTGVVVTNAAPTVSSGPDQEVGPSDRVTLVGTASDSDGHTPLSYRWEQVAGPVVTLSGATAATASFTAPAVEAVLAFELTVTDSRGKSASDTVSIEVRRNVAAPNLIFLPMLGRGDGGVVNTPADLAVSAFTVTPADLRAGVPVQMSVTVTNKGGTAAGAFWVDLYINPSAPPTAAGVTWDTTCTLDPCHGVAWLVEKGLAPGESIVLTLDPSSYYAANTRWFGSFAPGTNALYVYADSWNLSNPAGIVPEGDETNNRAQIVVGGATAQPRAAAGPGPDLPQRFIPGR